MTVTAIEVLKAAAPVMPVIEIPSLELALPLAESLALGGIRTLEITLRTECALAAIELIAKQFPELLVGAGTAKSVKDYQQAFNAGAQFVISPGLTQEMKLLTSETVPLIPGVMTASEVMAALDAGFKALKLFPASALGPNFLKAIAGPFPEAVFCPTGGVSPDNMNTYLELDNVLCVGGSWLAPRSLVLEKNWPEIRRLAQQLQNKQ